MLELFYYPLSPFARKVRMALEEKQLPYERVFVNLARGEQYGAAFQRLNPHGKVPVLKDGAVVVHESAAILAYLDERYPERPLVLTALEARARARALELVADSRFAKVLGPLTLERIAETHDAEERRLIARAHASADWHLAWLDGELAEREWLAGEFSVADVAFAAMFGTLVRVREIPGRLTHLRRWLDALAARPTWRFVLSPALVPRRKTLLRPAQCEGCGLPPFDRRDWAPGTPACAGSEERAE
jgi:glutathione S-transferase